MAIPAMALLQRYDARRDILIESAARRRAAIEARGHSELRAQSGRKNQLACLFVSRFVCTITSERLNVGHQTWQLGTLYKNLARVQVKVKDQGQQGQKMKNCRVIPIDNA